MLVSDLVNNTLINIGVISAGDTPATQDYSLGFAFVNLQIDALNAAVKKAMFGAFDPSLFTFIPVTDLVNPGDTITLPNGWPRALQYLAAVDLCPAFGLPPREDLVELAGRARAAIITPPTAPA